MNVKENNDCSQHARNIALPQPHHILFYGYPELIEYIWNTASVHLVCDSFSSCPVC